MGFARVALWASSWRDARQRNHHQQFTVYERKRQCNTCVHRHAPAKRRKKNNSTGLTDTESK